MWLPYLRSLDWRNLTGDTINEIIESDQFKAVVMVAVIASGFIGYVLIVNSV
jgi:hypothetical protein